MVSSDRYTPLVVGIVLSINFMIYMIFFVLKTLFVVLFDREES